MEHLRSYRLFEDTNIPKECINLLNYKLIADLKDLSMDLFDRGLTLFIKFSDNYKTHFLYREFGGVYTNHDIEEYYFSHKATTISSDTERIKYSFDFASFDEDDMEYIKVSYFVHPDIENDVDEILYRISAMYPEEDIVKC